MAATEKSSTSAMVEVPSPALRQAPEPVVSWFQAIGALIFVLVLFLALAAVLKRLQQRGILGGLGRTSAQPECQLAIEQSLLLDPKTRMLLVRRGDVGHLLCLHAQGATVVESNIPLHSAASKDATA